jgi:hypothetical protein
MSTEHWIKKIEPELKDVLELPAESFSIPLDISEMSNAIAKKLNISPFSVEIGNSEWKVKDSFFSGLSSNPSILSVRVEKESGDFFWIMQQPDIEILISWMKDLSGKSFEITHPDLLKGMYQYTTLLALDTLSHTEAFQSFNLKIVKDAKLPEKGYAVDICLKHDNEKIWAKLIVTDQLKNAFIKKFSKDSLDIVEIAKKMPNLKTSLIISNGSIELNKSELNSLSVGDFIKIDNAFFKPSEGKGSLKVSLSDKPLFQIKLKDGKFKILDYIYDYSEEAMYAE